MDEAVGIAGSILKGVAVIGVGAGVAVASAKYYEEDIKSKVREWALTEGEVSSITKTRSLIETVSKLRTTGASALDFLNSAVRRRSGSDASTNTSEGIKNPDNPPSTVPVWDAKLLFNEDSEYQHIPAELVIDSALPFRDNRSLQHRIQAFDTSIEQIDPTEDARKPRTEDSKKLASPEKSPLQQISQDCQEVGNEQNYITLSNNLSTTLCTDPNGLFNISTTQYHRPQSVLNDCYDTNPYSGAVPDRGHITRCKEYTTFKSAGKDFKQTSTFRRLNDTLPQTPVTQTVQKQDICQPECALKDKEIVTNCWNASPQITVPDCPRISLPKCTPQNSQMASLCPPNASQCCPQKSPQTYPQNLQPPYLHVPQICPQISQAACLNPSTPSHLQMSPPICPQMSHMTCAPQTPQNNLHVPQIFPQNSHAGCLNPSTQSHLQMSPPVCPQMSQMTCASQPPQNNLHEYVKRDICQSIDYLGTTSTTTCCPQYNTTIQGCSTTITNEGNSVGQDMGEQTIAEVMFDIGKENFKFNSQITGINSFKNVLAMCDHPHVFYNDIMTSFREQGAVHLIKLLELDFEVQAIMKSRKDLPGAATLGQARKEPTQSKPVKMKRKVGKRIKNRGEKYKSGRKAGSLIVESEFELEEEKALEAIAQRDSRENSGEMTIDNQYFQLDDEETAFLLQPQDSYRGSDPIDGDQRYGLDEEQDITEQHFYSNNSSFGGNGEEMDYENLHQSKMNVEPAGELNNKSISESMNGMEASHQPTNHLIQDSVKSLQQGSNPQLLNNTSHPSTTSSTHSRKQMGQDSSSPMQAEVMLNSQSGKDTTQQSHHLRLHSLTQMQDPVEGNQQRDARNSLNHLPNQQNELVPNPSPGPVIQPNIQSDSYARINIGQHSLQNSMASVFQQAQTPQISSMAYGLPGNYHSYYESSHVEGDVSGLSDQHHVPVKSNGSHMHGEQTHANSVSVEPSLQNGTNTNPALQQYGEYSPHSNYSILRDVQTPYAQSYANHFSPSTSQFNQINSATHWPAHSNVAPNYQQNRMQQSEYSVVKNGQPPYIPSLAHVPAHFNQPESSQMSRIAYEQRIANESRILAGGNMIQPSVYSVKQGAHTPSTLSYSRMPTIPQHGFQSAYSIIQNSQTPKTQSMASLVKILSDVNRTTSNDVLNLQNQTNPSAKSPAQNVLHGHQSASIQRLENEPSNISDIESQVDSMQQIHNHSSEQENEMENAIDTSSDVQNLLRQSDMLNQSEQRRNSQNIYDVMRSGQMQYIQGLSSVLENAAISKPNIDGQPKPVLAKQRDCGITHNEDDVSLSSANPSQIELAQPGSVKSSQHSVTLRGLTTSNQTPNGSEESISLQQYDNTRSKQSNGTVTPKNVRKTSSYVHNRGKQRKQSPSIAEEDVALISLQQSHDSMQKEAMLRLESMHSKTSMSSKTEDGMKVTSLQGEADSSLLVQAILNNASPHESMVDERIETLTELYNSDSADNPGYKLVREYRHQQEEDQRRHTDANIGAPMTRDHKSRSQSYAPNDQRVPTGMSKRHSQGNHAIRLNEIEEKEVENEFSVDHRVAEFDTVAGSKIVLGNHAFDSFVDLAYDSETEDTESFATDNPPMMHDAAVDENDDSEDKDNQPTDKETNLEDQQARETQNQPEEGNRPENSNQQSGTGSSPSPPRNSGNRSAAIVKALNATLKSANSSSTTVDSELTTTTLDEYNRELGLFSEAEQIIEVHLGLANEEGHMVSAREDVLNTEPTTFQSMSSQEYDVTEIENDLPMDERGLVEEK